MIVTEVTILFGIRNYLSAHTNCINHFFKEHLAHEVVLDKATTLGLQLYAQPHRCQLHSVKKMTKSCYLCQHRALQALEHAP